MLFEHREQPPVSRGAFARRLLLHGGYALALIAFSLGVGMGGYHWLADLRWVDAFVNASMLLAGMGPVDPLRTDAAKVFAGCYALYSGLIFVAVALLLLTPVFHRVLHRFHWEGRDR